MAQIRVESLVKSFGRLRLFAGLSLQIDPLKYVCLLGPSGCGKSTLIRSIAGLDSPDAGNIYIGGERVTDRPPHARDIGLAFQNYALYPQMSVRENLAFPVAPRIRRGQYTRDQIRQRVELIARGMRIESLPRAIGQSAERRTAATCRARSGFDPPPARLLLDEPLTHLDARLRYEMRAELKLLHRAMHTTTVHVTHDQQEALAVSDVIVVMKAGLISRSELRGPCTRIPTPLSSPNSSAIRQ